MRYAIFSDVHSNLSAFSNVLDYFKKQNIDKYVFVGDIVGYYTDINECIYSLRNLNPVCVAGNHDWAVIGKFNIEYFNDIAKEAILWTKNKISIEDIYYLNSFEILYEEENFCCVHGSLYNPEDFNYIFTIEDVRLNFSLLKKQILFVGHTHKPVVYIKDDDKIFYSLDTTIKILEDKKYIINVGSIGQPRDGDNRSCVCIYDTDKNIVILERLSYNIKDTAKKVFKAKLPKELGERLYTGV